MRPDGSYYDNTLTMAQLVKDDLITKSEFRKWLLVVDKVFAQVVAQNAEDSNA